jgi:hypothetical protein
MRGIRRIAESPRPVDRAAQRKINRELTPVRGSRRVRARRVAALGPHAHAEQVCEGRIELLKTKPVRGVDRYDEQRVGGIFEQDPKRLGGALSLGLRLRIQDFAIRGARSACDGRDGATSHPRRARSGRPSAHRVPPSHCPLLATCPTRVAMPKEVLAPAHIPRTP